MWVCCRSFALEQGFLAACAGYLAAFAAMLYGARRFRQQDSVLALFLGRRAAQQDRLGAAEAGNAQNKPLKSALRNGGKAPSRAAELEAITKENMPRTGDANQPLPEPGRDFEPLPSPTAHRR